MSKKKIAIIEDDQAISQMYRIKFEAEGYEVETAENGILGLALAEKMRPDIILLDLMMPEMNGDEMLMELRKKPWGKNTKVVILTNVGQDDVTNKLDHQQIDGFIVKALVTPKIVAQKISAILNKDD